jgi:hypothetical protein
MEPDASSSVGGRLGKGGLLSDRPYGADDPCLPLMSMMSMKGLSRLAVVDAFGSGTLTSAARSPESPRILRCASGSAAARSINELFSDGAVSVL